MSKELPSLNRLSERHSVKLMKEPKSSLELSRELEQAEKGLSGNTTYTLKRSKKSLTLHTKNNSPDKKPMHHTLISLKHLKGSELLKNP